MVSSAQVAWTVFGFIAIIVIAGLTTALILFIERSRAKIGPTSFACGIPNPGPTPDCASTVVTSGIPGSANGTGFFTSSSLIITPSLKPTPSQNPTPPLTGYYHAHPTGYYNFSLSSRGILYSYPFVLQVVTSGSTSIPPTMHMAAYNYSSQPIETTGPFDQYSYQATGLDTFTNGYTMNIPCAMQDQPFTPDFIAYPLSGGPTLTSVLGTTPSTAPASRITRIITTQGTPYTMLTYQETVTGPTLRPVLSINAIYVGSTSQETIIVTSPPTRTFNAYLLWSSGGGSVGRCMIWFCDASIPQTFTNINNEWTLSVGTNISSGLLQGVVYMTMFAQVGPLLGQVIQLIANSLVPYFINLADIIPSSSNTTMQFTLVPMPGITVGTTLQSGSSTLWIAPPTAFTLAALSGVSLPGTGYLDFPLGNGLNQTLPQVGSQLSSFYTLWPPPADPVSDFTSYNLSAVNFTDTSTTTTTDLDMYDLALAIRVLNSTANHAYTQEQINACVSVWQAKLNDMGVGDDYTLFTQNLGSQDAGLVSRIAYLLLTYIHLNAVNPSLSINSSVNGVISNATSQLIMLIEGGLTTASLSSQQASSLGIPVYTPLAFLDVYTATIPVIKTVGYSVTPTSLPQLSSRFGETLGYLWACDFLVSGSLAASSGLSPQISYLARTLISITNESSVRILRGQCSGGTAIPSLAPVMPWTTLVSPSQIGFQLDGATPGGTSPDSTHLQTFTPFTPASHYYIRNYLSSISIQVDKLLRCTQQVPQALSAPYSYNGFVDSNLVGYFAYLYTVGNRATMLETGIVDTDLLPFIKMITLQHPAVALLMNQVKQGLSSSVIVTRF